MMPPTTPARGAERTAADLQAAASAADICLDDWAGLAVVVSHAQRAEESADALACIPHIV